MTTQTARGLPVEETDEERVIRHLTQHPAFFAQQTPLLARLRLPHARGSSSISLIERQVEVLREQRQTTDRKLAEFVSVARANDQLSDRIHRFTRRLMRATDKVHVVTALGASLREDFDSFHATLILTEVEPAMAQAAGERFLRQVSLDDPQLKSFENLFGVAKPRCGQVRDSQRAFLFGSDASEIGSVALVPLSAGANPIGLLALGSAERERFHPGMSTEFLQRMGELIADALTHR